MIENKKVWMEPELIVLVRSRPEEAVLGACKQLGTTGDNGPNAGAGYCAGQFCMAGCDGFSNS